MGETETILKPDTKAEKAVNNHEVVQAIHSVRMLH
jgi:hypothetical protein